MWQWAVLSVAAWLLGVGMGWYWFRSSTRICWHCWRRLCCPTCVNGPQRMVRVR